MRCGDRVRHETHRATVRYVGQLQGHDGEWVGVEWDDAARGRHDGCVGGRRYFECQRSGGGGGGGSDATPASFVRRKKLCGAVSLVRAIADKYGGGSSGSARGEPADLSLRGKNAQHLDEFRISVQFVGEQHVSQKLSKLEQLVRVSLRGTNVQNIDENLDEIIPSVRELDLEDTLIDSWEEVSSLCRQLPLVELRLSRNALPPSMKPSLFPQPLNTLRILMLNSLDNAWQHVYSLARSQRLPALEELYLCANHLSNLADIDSEPASLSAAFPSLRHLDLTDNEFTSWERIRPLGFLPKLETLHLDGNQLEDIVIHGGEGGFDCLTTLSLFGNPISTWAALDGLARLPALRDLRFQKTALHNQFDVAFVRSVCIARLESLLVLNRSQISARERQNSCVRLLHTDLSQLEPLSEEFKAHVKSLFQKLDVTVTPAKSSGPSSFAIPVDFRSNDASSMSRGVVRKMVALSMTVGMAKKLCQRLFKLDANMQELYFKDSPMCAFPTVLEEDSKPLSFYSVSAGGEIIMEKRVEK